MNSVKLNTRISKFWLLFMFLLFLIFPVYSAFNQYEFPSSFIEENYFTGQIVIGANATNDVLSSNLILNSILRLSESETIIESDNAKKQIYEVEYSKKFEDSDVIDVLDKNDLNYGEIVGEEVNSNGLDETDSNFLDDEKFDNKISDSDYEQFIILKNGEFNYALREEVKNIEEITNGIYYENNQVFAEYVIEFKVSFWNLDWTNSGSALNFKIAALKEMTCIFLKYVIF